ncbi:MAG: DUF1156 domain-containing protein [Cenarchaeum sp. SB0661_bin_35]|nr:DUF1156 domain-containing protein [Cenarchaeum sp. SB0667_bin_13]MYC78889.1 DUF1156 domain-containing protein [Cenarchaeum sp. SB0661_bin_35]
MVGETKNRLIGTIIPIEEISKGGAAEKNKKNNRINNLHRWWASRPTTVSRITAYAALVDPPIEEHKEMILNMCDYYNTTKPDRTTVRESARKRIKEKWKNPPKVLDPFGGTGALPFSAAWLGCESHSMDYNPVAVLIQKCALEYPPKYGQKLKEDVKKYAEKVGELLKERTAQFHPSSDHYGYIWCRTVQCKCGYIIPLVHDYTLSKRRGIHFRPAPRDGKIEFTMHNEGEVPPPQVGGKRAICVKCGRPYTNLEIRDMIWDHGSEMMCVAVSIPKQGASRQYRSVTEKDHTLYELCTIQLEEYRARFREKYGVDPIPDMPMPTPDDLEFKPGGPSWHVLLTVTYGYTRWSHLFNNRQLLCMVILLEILRGIERDVVAQYGRDHGTAIMTYLGLVVDKTLEKYCRLSPWKTQREGSYSCFAQQNLGNAWDYPEVVPHDIWEKSTKSVVEGLSTALSNNMVCGVRRASATDLPYESDTFDAVCTDPPYYDSMQYSKTADFFYVWLKRSIGHLHPGLFRGTHTPKKNEVVETASDVIVPTPECVLRDSDGYQELMSQSLREMYRVLKPDGILTLVYAHKTTEGWETLIKSILDAGFTITAAWPVDTEYAFRMGAQGTASLASSIYMVARKWERKPAAEWHKVRRELKHNTCDMLDGLIKAKIMGSDFYIAAIGSALEIFGKYKAVRMNDGTEVGVDFILDEIRKLCSEFIVKTLTTGQGGNIDNLTKLYLVWRWSYGSNNVSFDVARKMFTGVGLNMDDYTGKGGIVKIKKTKSKSDVRLLTHQERDDEIQIKGSIDVIHQAIRLLNANKRDEANELLFSTGNVGGEFNAVCKAIAEAGRSQGGQSDESREIEQFWSGQQGVVYEPEQGQQRITDFK